MSECSAGISVGSEMNRAAAARNHAPGTWHQVLTLAWPGAVAPSLCTCGGRVAQCVVLSTRTVPRSRTS